MLSVTPGVHASESAVSGTNRVLIGPDVTPEWEPKFSEPSSPLAPLITEQPGTIDALTWKDCVVTACSGTNGKTFVITTKRRKSVPTPGEEPDFFLHMREANR